MYADILKQLFLELFIVNHLMLELIDDIEDTDCGDEILVEFYIRKITDEFDKKGLLEHKKECSYSCLGSLTEEQIEEFLNDLFNGK